MKILLVEDDAALAREIMRGLHSENFVVDHDAEMLAVLAVAGGCGAIKPC